MKLAGWKMILEGFMEPLKLGQTVEEAKASIRDYAEMGFGITVKERSFRPLRAALRVSRSVPSELEV
jgi:hypothetical protein